MSSFERAMNRLPDFNSLGDIAVQSLNTRFLDAVKSLILAN